MLFRSSHYIGIPDTSQPWKKKKCKNTKTTDKVKEKLEQLYKENEDKTKKERKEIIAAELVKELKDTELTTYYVNQQFERKRRNETERRKRLYRKVYLQEWNIHL